MQYRCGACDTRQWRGFFPEATFHLRYAIFHGLGIGVCGVATKLLFARLGLSTTGWRNGPASLVVCALLLLGFYAVAMFAERRLLARCPCRACGACALHPE
jgi:hypothetical protein